MGGPCRISTPAFPNLPIFAGLEQIGLLSGQPGTLNAATLNQFVAVGPPAGVRLAPAMRSGRPPNVFVLEGSKPSKLGVKNCPVCSVTTADIRQPPSTASATPGMLLKNR